MKKKTSLNNLYTRVLNTTDIWGLVTLCCGERPGHCRTFKAPLACTHQTVVALPSHSHPTNFQALPNVPWGTKQPPPSPS